MTMPALVITDVDNLTSVSINVGHNVCVYCPKEKGDKITIGGMCHECKKAMLEKGRDVFKRMAKSWFLIDKRSGSIVCMWDSHDEIRLEPEHATNYFNYWLVSPSGNKFDIPSVARLYVES